jgi:hypothetical protein
VTGLSSQASTTPCSSNSAPPELPGGTGTLIFYGAERMRPYGCPDGQNLLTTKTGGLNFRTAGQTFSPPIARPCAGVFTQPRDLLDVFVIITQIFLHKLPVNVSLENRPLSEARPKCVRLCNHPTHHRSGNSNERGMKPVNHGEHDKDAKHQPNNP